MFWQKPKGQLCLVIAWLVVTLGLFWSGFWSLIRPFDPQGLYLHGEQKLADQLSAWVEGVTPMTKGHLVIHWLDPECGCYRFSKDYVRTLMADAAENTEHWVMLKSPDPEWQESGYNSLVIDEAQYRHSLALIPSSPATTVVNAGNHGISYFGPHTSGALCGQGQGYVPMVLTHLQQGRDPEFINTGETGCFCPW